MNILVTGANGFVGKPLCAELFRQGHTVRAAVRTKVSPIKSVEVTIVGEIDSGTDWSTALRDVDVVVHLAARVHVMNETAVDPLTEFRKVNVYGALNLARHAANVGVKRFIFISTIGVNGNSTNVGQSFTADENPHPHDPYSTSKYEAEKGLFKLSAETGMEVVVIRPPLVYGYEASGNFSRLINALNKKTILPFGAIHNKRSFVYVGNLVSLIMRCIDHPAAANQIFLVSDGQDISTTELLLGCADALDVKARLLPVPQKLVEVCATIIGKRDVAQRLCGNLQVDITKARTLLGWTPPISVTDGLKATAQGLAQGE